MLLNIFQETLHFEYHLVVERAGPQRVSSVAVNNVISGDADIGHEKIRMPSTCFHNKSSVSGHRGWWLGRGS